MRLSQKEKDDLKRLIDEERPIPRRYRGILEEAPEVELIWQGKTSEVTQTALPFQSIEQIDEPRKEHIEGKSLDLFTLDLESGRQAAGWTNKLIWGDNKLVLSSLKNGPMRKEIEEAGGLKLIYIDPPFDVGADFSVDVEIGNETLTKEPSQIEELAYRDTWGRGADSFISMIYERLTLMRDLLSDDGSIYVHCDWRVNPYIRAILDELFGSKNFVNQIVWKRTFSHSDVGQGAKHMGRLHDYIVLYGKTDNILLNTVYTPYTDKYVKDFYKYSDPDGKQYRLVSLLGPGGAAKGNPSYEFLGVTRFWVYSNTKMQALYEKGLIVQTKPGTVPQKKRYIDEAPGVPLQDLWMDIAAVQGGALENANYPTQKPSELLSRVIESSSNPGDLVADFFCGSGTTLAVAEKLGRKWIGCDLGRFAIHTSRKRLIGVQRELKKEGKPYRSFEILNLGKYERQYFLAQAALANVNEEEKKELAIIKEEQYVNLILSAYKAERVLQMPPFHGKRGRTGVVVGPVDAPVTQSQVREIVAACRKMKMSSVDVLGFEFEMGLSPAEQDEARKHGVEVALKYIPAEVFDKRAIEKGQVKFYDVAYLEAEAKPVKGEARTIRVSLKDFGVFYRQDSANELGETMKSGASRVMIDNGQVVKVTKDKKGIVSKEILTKKWTDWIDYWAVDFDFGKKPEFVRTIEDGVEMQRWTGNYIFENEWQSYRTKKERSLELTSAEYSYPDKGVRKIAVKVIDIFGNDTTKVLEVKI